MRSFLVVVLLLLSNVSYAADIDSNVSQNAERYLNSIKTFAADFVQLDPQKTVTKGKFYLKRPGKFRWEYDKILINSDGKILVYFDKELNETTYAPIDQTLAGFLAKKNIKFSGDIKLLEAVQDGDLSRVTLTQKDKPEEGTLSLIFKSEPMEFVMMEVKDNLGNKTQVTFENPQCGVAIEDKKFVFKDPKFHKDAWDKK